MESHHRIASFRDLALLIYLGGLTPLAWLAPERHWDKVCAGLAWHSMERWPRKRAARIKNIRAVLGRRAPSIDLEACHSAFVENIVQAHMQFLRCYRPGGWHPRIQLHGRHHIEHALAQRRGAVLWMGTFVFNTLVGKMAMRRNGYRVSHLSRVEHFLSNTDFGVRWLNPIVSTIERRHLGDRVVLGRGIPDRAVLDQLTDRLRQNGLISILVSGDGRRPMAIPFMDGEIRLAVGALRMAQQCDAALLPVFTVRESDGGYTTVVEPALDLPRGALESAGIRRVFETYAALLETYVLRYPDQFFWWNVTPRQSEMPTVAGNA